MFCTHSDIKTRLIDSQDPSGAAAGTADKGSNVRVNQPQQTAAQGGCC
jgi:hypothetical protein